MQSVKGNQIPRVRIEPDRIGTDGTGAAMLMAAYGVTLDEWQRLVLDSWLSTDANGDYIVTSAGLSTPRQNGKNCILEARELYGLIVNGERILHTAHQVRTAKKSFRRLASIFTDKKHPEIVRTVKKIRYGIGEESIELDNGGLIEFTARSRQAARGYDGISLVVYDEAQELTDEQAEAIMAVLSASTTGTRQLIYAGTPPYIGCTGEVFRRFRQACIEGRGEEKRSSWHEWGMDADSLQDVDLSNRKLWAECNPAYNIRLSEEFTAEEFKTLSPDGFARERLGWWVKHAAAEEVILAIDAKLWDHCASDDKKPEGKTAYGVKFSADGAEVCLCGAVIPPDGPARISLIRQELTGAGLAWLSSWLNERYKVASCVVIDGRGSADVLIDRLRPAGGGSWVLKDSVVKASVQNVAAAAEGLLNDLREERVTWYRPQGELRESALSATKRPIRSGGWAFGGDYSTPIEAAALALWGCRNTRRNPQRKMRLG